MIIRKFVIALVTKFDPKGFNDADKSVKSLAAQAQRASKEFDDLTARIKRSAEATKKLADAEDDAADELGRLMRRADETAKRIAKLNGQIDKSKKRLNELGGTTLKKVGASFTGARERLDKFKSALAPVGDLVRSVGRGLAVLGGAGIAAATAVIRTGSSFESLRVQLANVTQSAAKGEAAFGFIKDFARNTPFQVDEITRSFIGLQTRGVEPTGERLTALGDLAATFGKPIEDATAAATAAATGETERLKALGITAKVAGDQIELSFRGSTVTVEKNAVAVTDALTAFGQMQGVAGAMAVQMDTTAGRVSNLKDTFFNLLDQVAQMGVLEEFNGLLGDLAGVAGTEGLAGIIAKTLVDGLKQLRSILARITQQDIEDFLEGAAEGFKILGQAIEFGVKALQSIVESSENAGGAFEQLGLAVLALVAAFTGPAGLAVASVFLGRMIANLVADFTGLNDEIRQTEAEIERVQMRIARLESERAKIKKTDEATEAKVDQIIDRRAKNREAAAKEFTQQEVGGLQAGAGLLAEGVTETDVFRAGESETERRARILTAGGQQVFAEIDKAEQRREDRAARAARRTGGDEAAARQAARAGRGARRKKALTQAQKTFGATGEFAAAGAAGAKAVEGKKRGGKGKGADFFEFEDKAGAEAKGRGEVFAAQELERLRGEGVEFREALAQSKAAGRERAAELKQKFLDAGRILEEEDSILDIIGLRGPGSLLKGRPAPEVLTINVAPIFNFNLTMALQGLSDATLAEAVGAGGQAAVEAGAAGPFQMFKDMFNASIRLEADRIISAAGGGQQTEGPPG